MECEKKLKNFRNVKFSINEKRVVNETLIYRICDKEIHETLSQFFHDHLQNRLLSITGNFIQLSEEILKLDIKYTGVGQWTEVSKEGISITEEMLNLSGRLLSNLEKVLIQTDIFSYSENSFQPADLYLNILTSYKTSKLLKQQMWRCIFVIRLTFVQMFGKGYRKELDIYLENVSLHNPFIFKWLGCKNGFPGIDSFERFTPFRGELRKINLEK